MDVSVRNLRAMRREERDAAALWRDPDAPQPLERRPTDLYGAVHVVDVRRELVDLLQHHIDATDVLVLVKDGAVTLAGVVSDPLDRQIAEDLVWSMPEVKNCENRIEVVRDDD